MSEIAHYGIDCRKKGTILATKYSLFRCTILRSSSNILQPNIGKSISGPVGETSFKAI